MKMDLKSYGNSDVLSTATVKGLTLSEDSAGIIFQIFSKNIYSNPIGSVVREITSNCFDSHVEAGVDAPVIIRNTFDQQANTHYISFIDFGMGMSPERINGTYSVYFQSTKRESNDQIGGFGLGSKCPLAYKRATGHGQGEYDNSFYVITVFDHVKYYYCIFEGTESPMISLLHSEATTEGNGTEVKIPVLERDIDKFASEMVRQLYYFENVIFEGFNSNVLKNDYQIIRGKNFLYRGNEYSNTAHVCLGRVAYPIDYNVLGLNSSSFNIPVAIRLEIGEVNVTASRENLDYSENTIKVLKKRLIEVKAELIEMITKQHDDIVTLEDYFKFNVLFGHLFITKDKSINLSSFINKSDVKLNNYKYQMFRMPDEYKLFDLFFNTKQYGAKIGRYGRNDTMFNCRYSGVISNKNLLYINGGFDRKMIKQAYLNHLHKSYYIVGRKDLTDNLLSEINHGFGIKLDSYYTATGNNLAVTDSLIEMQNDYMQIIRNHCTDYDAFEVPDDFIASRKRKKKEFDSENIELNITLHGSYGKQSVNLSTLFKHKGTIFYGVQDDYIAIKNAYVHATNLFEKNVVTYYDGYCKRFGNKPQVGGMVFITIAKNNVKYLKQCPNAYHISEFNNKILYRKLPLMENISLSDYVKSKIDDLNDLFISNELIKINEHYGKIAIGLNQLYSALPTYNSRICDSIKRSSGLLEKVLDNKPFAIKKQELLIKKMFDIQTKNEKILKYIRIPSSNDFDSELTTLLQKILIF